MYITLYCVYMSTGNLIYKVMKSTLKISAIILTFTALTYTAKAQTTTPSPATGSSNANAVRFSIGVDGGIPTGKLSDSYNFSIGGSLQADIPVVPNLFVTINAGYNSIQGKNNVNINGGNFSPANIQLLPAKAGLKYFIVPNFYIQGEAGAAFLLNKSDLGDDKSAAFIYAPQIGYQFHIGGNSYIDAGVRYEASTKFNSMVDDSKVNFFGLRVAYGF
jgi:hypothetical protein